MNNDRFIFLAEMFSQVLTNTRSYNNEEVIESKDSNHTITCSIINDIVNTYIDFAEKDASLNLSAKYIHDIWVFFMKKDGWVYGDVKSHNQKTHDCLVEYEDLSFNQKFKDEILLTLIFSYIRHLRDEFLKGEKSLNDINSFFNRKKATKKIVEKWMNESHDS